MKQVLLSLIGIFLISTSCQENNNEVKSESKSKSEETANTKAPTEEEVKIGQLKSLFGILPKIAENPNNTVTDEKVNLGRKLYFDPRLSKSGEISCNSCHNLASFGVDNLPTSIGHKWQTGARNSPTTLNAALQFVQFWDGREADVEAQAKGPVLNPIEMGSPHQEFVIDRLKSIPEYVNEFATVFGSNDSLSYQNMAMAIGAFERTLMTPSRFDSYLEGDTTALNSTEKKGLETFKSIGCTTCHSGVLLGGTMYQKFGIFKPFTNYGIADDLGKQSATKSESDKYLFKVPTLRNITRTYPYFHDGSIWDLKQSIQIMAETQLNKTLTEEESTAIVSFLTTLEGKLSNEQLQLPILPASTANTSKPDFN